MFREHYEARVSALKLDIAHIENKILNEATSEEEVAQLRKHKMLLKEEVANYLARIYEM